MFDPMPLTAKSLILDLLSTLRRGSMPVAALVAAGQLFGIAENNVRVSLARLTASAAVERDERGRYRLGARTEAIRSRVASWRRPEERMRPWEGGWIGVHSGKSERGAALRRSQQALRFRGFRELAPGLRVRPDNLAGGIAGVREQLVDLGLGGGSRVFAMSELDPASDLRARSLWDAHALAEEYERSQEMLEESASRLPGLPPDEAMVESFLVGGRVLRSLVLDPLLPEPIFPARARSRVAEAMRAYDRAGRACWARFLERFDVPHLRTPVDLRVAEAAQRVGPQPHHRIHGDQA
jgi:phenylacetic acid degradation operon negative regulatory protein